MTRVCLNFVYVKWFAIILSLFFSNVDYTTEDNTLSHCRLSIKTNSGFFFLKEFRLHWPCVF